MKPRAYALSIPVMLTLIIFFLSIGTFERSSALANTYSDNLAVLTNSQRVLSEYDGQNLLVDYCPPPLCLVWSSTESDSTYGVAWGDYDRDGDLDLVVGNDDQPIRLYQNDNGMLTTSAVWSSAESAYTRSIAWGDYDGDGDLDLAVGNSGSNGPHNRLYRNDNEVFTSSAVWSSTESDNTQSVSWGDYDGDGDLDLAVGNSGQPNRLYRNDNGILTPSAVWSSIEITSTYSIAWGDYDGDGDLDLAAGNHGVNRLYRNDNGILSSVWVSIESDGTYSIAWGDYDGDGDLDLAVGNGINGGHPNRLYRNDDGILTSSAVWSSMESDETTSVAWGDYDGDGDLDLAVGNGVYHSQPNRLYRNDNGILTSSAVWSSTESDYTTSIAWGDYDNDGDLDLAVGNGWNITQPNRLYHNDDGILTSSAVWSSTESDETTSVAWGDYDGDGDLDLAVGNGFIDNQPNRLYRNDNGILTPSAVWSSTESDKTYSIAWGDYDNDGDLDLAAGNSSQPNRLYRNDNGILTLSAVWSSTESDNTYSIAWGDYDNDGDLDLAAGNSGQPNRLYRNDNWILTSSAVWSSIESDYTTSVAWGDYDNDGDLDLAAGNFGQPNMLYRNDGGILNPSAIWASEESDNTLSIAWGDYDGDGNLDLATGNSSVNRIYHNDSGILNPSGEWSSIESDYTWSIAWGDYDGDGDLDLAAGNTNNPSRLYRNDNGVLTSSAVWSSANDTSTCSVAWGDYDSDGDLDLGFGNCIPFGQPNHIYKNGRDGLPLPGANTLISIIHPTSNADGYATPQILSGTIPITYTLFEMQSNPVREIRTEYSLNGGGNWITAIPLSGTITTQLTTTPYPTATLTNTHTFYWDTFASGFFGQSDNVVFRITAIPEISNPPNQTPGPYLYGSYATSTFPLRVRGTQVRVFEDTIAEENVAQNALVYRLPAGQASGGFPLANGAGVPFHTDQNGYLQGRGQIGEGDILYALWPITATETYTMYYTNLVPTLSGAEGFVVTDPGVQNIAISSAHPLILYNLDISLEWDARNDPIYLAQLQADLRLTSENLFDWTNGQASLGQIRIFHAKEHWNDADIRLYATNSLRPHAAVGGWVPEVLTETVTLGVTEVITYAPGQVHIGAVWNSFGNPVGNLGDDWPRALAHELGHYLFFLDDNYLGLDSNGFLISLDGCPGAMTNPYRNDDATGYDEFHPLEDWEEECSDTLSNQETGRADWETLTRFFPWLTQPIIPCPGDTCYGPNGLPLAVTKIQIITPLTPTTTLEDSTFFLFNASGGIYQNSTQARAYLFHGDRLTDLGQPVAGQLTARGTSPEDQLCVYDLPNQAQGCETISASDDQLVMTSFPNWEPDVRITPVTSVTHSIKVTAFDVSAPVLYARLYPLDSAPPVAITLDLVSPGVYLGSYENLPEPVLEGYLHVWVDEDEPRREIITDFSIGGNPGPRRSGGSGLAPVLSPDGQVLLYGENLNFTRGEFYFLQSATVLPQEVPWANVISKGYYLAGSQNAPPLDQTSLWFSYADGAVPPLQEEYIKVYFWTGNSWIPLDTQVDATRNSAVARTAGPGLYVLMSSYEQSVMVTHPDWAQFFFPYSTPQAVGEALASIDGAYTSVCYKETTDAINPWRCYGAGAPNWANDLKDLEAQSYFIYLKESVVIRYKGSPTIAHPPDTPADFLIPPAVFYGIVGEINGIQPHKDIPVSALVNGTPCGQTETFEIAGYVVYVIDVYAEDFGTHAGCGTPNGPFTLQALGYIKNVIWDHTEFHNVLLGIGKWFLPIIVR